MARIFRLPLVAASLFFALTLPLAAQDRAAPLRAMLQALPMSMLDPVDGSHAEITFGDSEAASTVIAQALGRRLIAAAIGQATTPFLMDFDSPIGPMLRVAEPDFGRAAYMAEPEGWTPLLGFGADDIRQMLSVRQLSKPGVIIRLDPALFSAIGATLVANGYAPLALGKDPAFARGADDYGMDINGRNVEDPFGGELGRSSRVALLQEGLLLQAAGLPELRMLTTRDSAMLGDAPLMQSLLTALDDPAAGSGAILRAMVFPTPFLLTATDPAPSGLRMGILADISDGIQVHATLALAYDSLAEAEAAAAALPQRWAEVPSRPDGPSYADLTGQTPVLTVTGEGPAVLLLTLTDTASFANFNEVNPLYDRLIGGVFSGGMTILSAD